MTIIEKIKIAKNTEITGKLISNIIQKWGKNPIDRFEKLEGYYQGEHDILNRTVPDGKPNNKLVINYAKLITINATSYFLGIPVTYESDKNDFLQKVFEILDDNVEEDVNFEHGKYMSISGVSYELIYADENANVRFKKLDCKTIIPVYSDDINEELILVIRHYETEDIVNNKKIDKADVYTDTEIIEFESSNGAYTETFRSDHYFGDVPVVEYLNNEERLGDFEIVLSLIDAYNKAQSDTANDFEEFTDAYLALTGMEGTEPEDIDELKEKRVLLVPENGKADWLIKTINDTATENYKSRLQDDTHRISQVPDLTDEKFAGNVSGEAMKYKLWGLEQITATKERKFKTALIKRIRLITNFLNIKGSQYDYNDINLKFHRNIPKNLLELVSTVKDLSGIVSEKTQLSLLPFIDDVDAEMKRKENEKKEFLSKDPYQQLGSNSGGNE
ncbi:phage portal protein [Bacillus sp. FJAT-49736]|uniref:phage portal protein n=1 Tax=Bacillus sp. FJAT-49736 TaxID=2833582 RepID=UPI001BCA04ED|nr:phage portal protein [Bacillus sp. FJAT-49736]